MNMINWLSNFLYTDDTKLIYLLTLIAIANILDFTVGWINAKFNKSVVFSSSKAIFGIARKMILIIIMVYFIPVALIIPEPIGITSLYVLFTGYLFSEINSLLSHLKISDDDKSTDRFIDFINEIFTKKGGK